MNRPLNPTDAALWDIERDPTLRTTIVAVLYLERPVDRDRLLNDLEAATRTIPKLRQRVVAGPAGMGTPHWELITDFDIADHVTFVETAEAPDDERVMKVSQELASSALDRSGALWSCTYLGGSSGRSVVLLKVHHSLTDGVGGMELLDAILDGDGDAAARELDDLPIPESTGSMHPLLAASNAAFKLADLQVDVAKLAVAAASHPVDTATGLWKGLQSTLRLLSPVSSTMSTLMTGRSPDRHAHTFDLDLEQMHVAAHKHSCTINHLLFAGVIEGIAAYHRQADHEVEGLRVLMPVSFRTSDGAASGNEWGPVRFTAPAAIKDPVERLRAMRTVLARSGNEPALEFSQQLAGAVQLLPSVLSSNIVSGMMHGVDVVVTNIPGLQEDRFLCGSRVDRVYAFAPTAGAALNVALVSHHGQACLGILSDAAAIELPDTLQQLIAESLHEVIAAAENTEPVPFVEPAPTPKVVDDSLRRLSALDTGFLELETPEAPMQLGAVIVVDGQPLRNEDGTIRLDVIRQHIKARLSRVPNFRRKLAEVPLGLGRPLWVDDEDFDISRHVRTISVARPGSEQDLLDLAAMLHEAPLDRNHPLWEIWLVDGLADGNIAVVKKVHHALADGVGTAELVAALFDPDASVGPEVPVPVRTRPAPSQARRIADVAFEQLADPLRLARSTTQMVLSPAKAFDQAKSLATAASDLLRPSAVAPSSSFNQAIGRGRSLQRVTVELGGLDEARREADASINDLVLAAIAGAMRQWLPLHGDNVFDVRAVVPVSVHHDGDSGTSGNQIGAVLITLPVGEPDPDRRLELVRDRMRRLKASHEGEGVALILESLDRVPARSLRAARLLSLQRMANLVITNVPGPADSIYFLGAEAMTIIPILPLGPNLGLGVAITSYRDQLTLGLFADPDLCPDLDALAQALEVEFDRYL